MHASTCLPALLLALLVVGAASPTRGADGPVASAVDSEWYLVVGSFSNRRRAQLWTRGLADRLPLDLTIVGADVPGDHSHRNSLPDRVFRVLAGPYARAGDGNAARQRAFNHGVTDAWFLRDLSRLGDNVEVLAAYPAAPPPAPPPADPAEDPAQDPAEQPAVTPTIQHAPDPGAEDLFTSAGPPPGFEFLLAEQTSMVDVFHGGRLVTSTLATFSHDQLTLKNPKDITSQLPDLLDPAAITRALQRPLPTNSERACLPGRPADGCGLLEPPVAGIIFTAERFRVDLFLAADQLRRRVQQVQKFLPGAEQRFSFLQNLNATLAGSGERDMAWSLGLLTTLAWGEHRVQALSAITDAGGLDVDALYWQRDANGRELAAGLLRTRQQGQLFGTDQPVFGVRLASSLATRTDLELAAGTPLDVFLRDRSRVEILKDGRLLQAGWYDAGNQQLDTRNLPEGVYEVTLRVRDRSGTRSETRLFSRSTRLPPRDQALWFVELGRLANHQGGSALPGDGGAWLGRAGLQQRLTDTLGAQASMAATDDNALLETGLFHMGRHHQVQTGAFADLEGAMGIAANAQLRLGDLSASADLRRVLNEREVAARVIPPDNVPGSGLLPLRQGPFQLAPDATSQQSLHLHWGLGTANLALSARRSRRASGELDLAQALSLNWPAFVTGHGRIELSVDLTHQHDDLLALAGIRWRFNGRGMAAEVSPLWRHASATNGGSGAQLDALVAWQNQRLAGADLATSFGISRRDSQQSATLQLEARHQRGEARGALSWLDGQHGSGLNWTGSFNTSLLGTRDALVFGGRDQANAAVLVRIHGTPADSTTAAEFDVLVDGYRVGTAAAGTTTAIHLRPFETYRIRIRQRSGGLLDFVDRTQQVTLYPGNVVHLDWRASEVVVLLARIVDEHGVPVANALAEGVVGMAATDSNGLLQAEVLATGAPVQLQLANSSYRCTASIDLPPAQQGVSRAGSVTCAPAR